MNILDEKESIFITVNSILNYIQFFKSILNILIDIDKIEKLHLDSFTLGIIENIRLEYIHT